MKGRDQMHYKWLQDDVLQHVFLKIFLQNSSKTNILILVGWIFLKKIISISPLSCLNVEINSASSQLVNRSFPECIQMCYNCWFSEYQDGRVISKMANTVTKNDLALTHRFVMFLRLIKWPQNNRVEWLSTIALLFPNMFYWGKTKTHLNHVWMSRYWTVRLFKERF